MLHKYNLYIFLCREREHTKKKYLFTCSLYFPCIALKPSLFRPLACSRYIATIYLKIYISKINGATPFWAKKVDGNRQPDQIVQSTYSYIGIKTAIWHAITYLQYLVAFLWKFLYITSCDFLNLNHKCW